MDSELVLASASPRRKELLSGIGLSFSVVAADVDESVEPGLSPAEIVCALSERKARAVSAKYPERYVLGADTIVAVLEESTYQILGKPISEEQAAEMLTELSGREHQVLSGITMIRQSDGYLVTRSVSTTVFMRALTEEEILAYIASGEPMDKAGAYGIQGKGEVFIPRIEGSYSNVVGLPMVETLEELERVGLWKPELLKEAASGNS